jgi:hypothetical protein
VKYRALSYGWEDPEPMYPVQLSGRNFKVRRNILEAPLQIRLIEDQIEMWVSAIRRPIAIPWKLEVWAPVS